MTEPLTRASEALLARGVMVHPDPEHPELRTSRGLTPLLSRLILAATLAQLAEETGTRDRIEAIAFVEQWVRDDLDAIEHAAATAERERIAAAIVKWVIAFEKGEATLETHPLFGFENPQKTFAPTQASVTNPRGSPPDVTDGG